MNGITKEKRDRLILVCIGTVFALLLIYFALIQPTYQRTRDINSKLNRERQNLQGMEDGIKNADTVAAKAMDLSETLAQNEDDMVNGDPASWIYDTIRNFKGHYKVDISVSGQLTTGDVDLLPRFPYKQIKVAVTGTAYYHDLGVFAADFENAFPHARIVNLVVEPDFTSGDSAEKLSFRMDIIFLVKPNASQS
jgi:hypothetical protein